MECPSWSQSVCARHGLSSWFFLFFHHKPNDVAVWYYCGASSTFGSCLTECEVFLCFTKQRSLLSRPSTPDKLCVSHTEASVWWVLSALSRAFLSDRCCPEFLIHSYQTCRSDSASPSVSAHTNLQQSHLGFVMNENPKFPTEGKKGCCHRLGASVVKMSHGSSLLVIWMLNYIYIFFLGKEQTVLFNDENCAYKKKSLSLEHWMLVVVHIWPDSQNVWL